MANIRTENIIAINGTNVAVASSAETVCYSVLIPAYTFRSGDIMEYFYRIQKANANPGVQKYSVYLNTVNAITGSPITLSTYTTATAQELIGSNIKQVVFKSDTSIQYYRGGYSDDVTTTSPPITSTINTAVDNYFIVTIQCGAGGTTVSTTTFSGALITRFR